MFSLYQQSVGYITNEMDMFGTQDKEAIERSVRARIQHIRAVVQSLPRDLEDSQKVMAELKKESKVFNLEQRREIGQIVSDHMAAKEKADSKAKVALQKNRWLHHYMPDTKWKGFEDPTIDWNEKKKMQSIFCCSFVSPTLTMKHTKSCWLF